MIVGGWIDRLSREVHAKDLHSSPSTCPVLACRGEELLTTRGQSGLIVRRSWNPLGLRNVSSRGGISGH